MRKQRVIINIMIIVAVGIVILSIAQVSSQTVQDRITILTAVLGFLAILYQLRSDHKIKRAEFIYSLNDSFNNAEDISKSYALLKQARDQDMDLELTKEQCMEMGSYLMFFMIMNYLVDKKLVSIKLIDKIFANKFFLFTNHPSVQKYQLESTDINYPIMELFEKWYNYRLVHRRELLYEKHCFSKNDKIFKRKSNGFIEYKEKEKKNLKEKWNILFNKPNITPESLQ